MVRSESECSTGLIPKVSSLLVIATILAMLPTIVLVIVPLVVYAEEENGDGAMDGMNDGSDLVSPITEWIGIGALAMTLSVVLPLGYNMIFKKGSKGNSPKPGRTKSYLFTLVGALSIAVGIIHLMLVKEHMEESYLWGIGFLAMGISQIACSVCGICCGIFVMFSKMLSSLKRLRLCKLAIIANAFFVGIFVYVRLVVPPFSPDGVPVSELEPNGILTVVIQLIIIAIMVYALREKKIKQQEITMVRKI